MTIPRSTRLWPWLVLVLSVPALADDPPRPAEAAIGASYEIPYRLSETNHFIVRVKLNGKGPFNLVVDTGAPALYLSTEAARRAGLKATPDGFFSRVDTLLVEGGAELQDVQARVEDIFQLVGMNALGLPGVQIDGMLGFNVLARFRITIDPTRDRMTWTRLDHEPPDLVVPTRAKAKAGDMPEVEALNLLGGVAKIAALFIGKQPEDLLLPRGFVGVELAEKEGAVTVVRVLEGSPAAKTDLKPGDRILDILGRDIESLADARKALSRVEPGDRVTVEVQPADSQADPLEIEITAAEGL